MSHIDFEPSERVVAALAKCSSREVVRENLVRAALLVTAYETLSRRIIDLPLSFFASEWGSDGLPLESEAYRQRVRSQHRKRFEASCTWLRDIGAIRDEDVQSIFACRDHRNEIVHSLIKYLIDPGCEIRLDVLDEIGRLHAGIDRWWITSIEVPTNPDFDGVEVHQDDVQSGTMLLMALILEVARGGPEAAPDA